MKAKQVLIAGITGTTFMTLFSYLISVLDNENYSEPERLGQLAQNVLPNFNKKQAQLTGWTAHYMVGLLFEIVYVSLWNSVNYKPSVKNNLFLGAISGIAAVAIWKATFKMHPLPPKLSFNKYYAQLVPAHVVFALFSGLSYCLLKELTINIPPQN